MTTQSGPRDPDTGVPAGEAPRPVASIRDRRVRERRVWRIAIALSLFLHGLVLLLGPRGSVPLSPFAAAGPRTGVAVAADGAMEAVALRSSPPAPLRPPAVPVVTVAMPDPQELNPEADPEMELARPDLPDPGAGASDGRDPEERGDAGIPEATGTGDGGSAAEGRFRVLPPTPRGMIMPPTNRDLRGTEVEVWVYVDASGRVVPDSTRLEPPTRDRRFNEELIRQAAEWVFQPARRDGEPVAAWFPYRISL